MEAGADPNTKNVFAPSAFEEEIASIRKRRGASGISVDVEERLGFMIEAGADLLARDPKTGNTALGAALSEISTPYGEPETVAKNLGFAKRLILMEPRLVNTRNHGGETPLHHACFCGNLEATVFLIAQGAGVDAVDRYGVSALIQAVNNASIACVEALLGAKALFPEFLPDGLDASTLYDLCVKASKRVSPVGGGATWK